jgi:hypothetical protein
MPSIPDAAATGGRWKGSLLEPIHDEAGLGIARSSGVWTTSSSARALMLSTPAARARLLRRTTSSRFEAASGSGPKRSSNSLPRSRC